LREQRLPPLEIRQQQVEHVPGLLAMRRDHRQADAARCRPVAQAGLVGVPDLAPPGLDALRGFKLGTQERGQQLRREVAGADVHPGVLVDLPAEEAAAIRTLLADDLGPLHVPRVVDQQRAALPADDVLGLVKALRRQHAEGARERPR